MRAAGSTYALFSVVFGIPMLLSALIAIRAPTTPGSAWGPVAVFAAMLLAFLIHFACLEVCVAKGVLSYRWLFGRRSISLTDVARSHLERKSGYHGWTQYLVITPASGDKALKFIVKPFRADDVRKLLASPELKFDSGHHVA